MANRRNIYKLEEYIYKTRERHTLESKVFGSSEKDCLSIESVCERPE